MQLDVLHLPAPNVAELAGLVWKMIVIACDMQNRCVHKVMCVQSEVKIY